jgi:CRISPR-associated protein Cmr3
MTHSITLTPVDTLFFRGAEPMEAGENHFMSFLFPPMPSTLLGALRTAMLVKNQIPFRDFVRRQAPDETTSVGKLLGTPEEAGFGFSGPLFVVENAEGQIPLLPAPAHWFTAKENLREENAGEPVTISEAQPLSQAARDFGLCASIMQQANAQWRWVTPPDDKELTSLDGYWITASALTNHTQLKLLQRVEELSPNQPLLLPQAALFQTEMRVGIGRDNLSRTAQNGRLYTTSHVRLTEGVRLLLLPDHDLTPALGTAGVVQLGGEQRVAQYAVGADEKILPSLTGKAKSSTWLSLSPIKSSAVAVLQPAGLASGKLRRIGGWEMKKGDGGSGNNQGFHREMEGWHPAGTVLFFEEARPVPHGWWGI